MVLNPEPTWSFTANKQLHQWYGHVRLLNDQVVGQWFVLNRSSGECFWERTFPRANTIFEISEGVILASETRSDGPWTASFGCYGISLSTGEMLWCWYGNGIRGSLARGLEFVPGYTNEFRPHFAGVRGKEFSTQSGDILDIRTGQFLRHKSEGSVPARNQGPQTDAHRIYYSQPVEIAPSLLLSTRAARMKIEQLPNGATLMSSSEQKRPFGFILRDALGQIVWDWSPTELGLHPITNFYGWRLIGNKLSLLCGEEPENVPIRPEKPLLVRPNATKYHLILIDGLTGKLDQKIMVANEKVKTCRIEDMDADGILVSCDNRHLRYYVFAH